MPNPYKNKVVYGGTVLIDLTDTTAEAEDVAAGKYFYDKTGARVEGTASSVESIVVVETEDSHGGTVVEITGEVVKLQRKIVTPSTSQQVISPDTGYTGMSQVTVVAIPAAYQDVTQVDATAGDVVSGKKFVNSSGTVVNGTLTFQTYYTGSSDPASSLGVNGDIYLKTS